MVKYIKCPRCELNYIDSEKQEYCDVCIAEIKGNKLQFADLEEDDFIDEMEEEKTDLCPICGTNYIHFGETMCEACRQKSEYEEDVVIDPDKDEEWKNYLEDETGEDLTIDDETLEEEMKEEFGDEEEYDEEYVEENDFDDDLDALDDEDFEDLDEDEDDDEDDDDDLF